MKDALNNLLGDSSFMPHGHCYLWQPGVLWLHAVSDAVIALAYFTIPLALVTLVRRRRDLAFSWMFVLFGVFILACGTTHIMGIVTIWRPLYWLDGTIKAVTAVASIGTALLVWPLIPKALAIPSVKALAEANAQLETHAKRQAAVAAFSQEALLGASIDDLTAQAVLIASEGLKMPLCAFLALRTGETELLLTAGRGWRDGVIGNYRVSADRTSPSGFALSEPDPVIVSDLATETRFQAPPSLLDRNVVSGLSVAVRGQADPHGVLSVYSPESRVFVPEEIHFFRALANVLGIAIERRQAEERLRLNAEHLASSNRELEAFSYSGSHDLRAPLRSVDGFSRMLLEDCGPALSAEGKRFVGVIRQNAEQMGHLIDDLLRFSRLGRTPLTRSPTNMNDLVVKATQDLQADVVGRNVRFKVAALPGCSADATLLRQVLVNLIGNAIKYSRTRAEAVIEIGTLTEDGVVAWFVRDNGIGFDMRYADKLFGAFQRLHLAEEYEGTGVGLAIVHRIIVRHGGRVWAVAAPDQGATFHFTVPGGGLSG